MSEEPQKAEDKDKAGDFVETASAVAGAAKEIAAGASTGGTAGAVVAGAKSVIKIGKTKTGRKLLIGSALSGLAVPLIGLLVLALIAGGITGMVIGAGNASAEASLRAQVSASESFSQDEMAAVTSAAKDNGFTWYILASVLAEQKWRSAGRGPFHITEGLSAAKAEDLATAASWVAKKLRAAALESGVNLLLDIGSGASVYEDKTVHWSDEQAHDDQVVQPWVSALQKLSLDGVSQSWAKTVVDQAINWRLGLFTEDGCAPPTGIVAAGAWIQPTIDADGKVTRGFGQQFHPVYHEWRMHDGVDLGNDKGTPIYAAASGKVVLVTSNSSAGWYVKIDHGAGVATQYLHMETKGDILVDVGQTVTAGTQIAKMGNGGTSTAPHLHFEVIVNGTKVDPEKFYAEKGLRITDKPSGASASAVSVTIKGSLRVKDSQGKAVTLTTSMLENAKTISQTIAALDPKKGAFTSSDRERLFVMAIQTAMAESSLGTNNGWGGSNDHVGIYQQNRQVGWYADGKTEAENEEILHDIAYQTTNLVLGHDTIKSTHIPGLTDQSAWRTDRTGLVVFKTQRPGGDSSIYDRWESVGKAVLAAFGGMLSSDSMPGCTAASEITVVEANILFNLPGAQWREDLATAGKDADVLILNESGGDRNQGYIKTYAEQNGYAVATFPGFKWRSITTLWRTEMGPQVASDAAKVCDPFDGRSARIVTWVSIDLGGQQLSVINSHAPPGIEKGGGPQGSKAARACNTNLLKQVKKVAGERNAAGDLVIVGADLNVNYVKDKKVKYAKFPYTMLEGREQGEEGLRSQYSLAGLESDGTHGKRYIDYIYVWKSPASPLDLTGYRIETATNSDHDFVVATVATGVDLEIDDDAWSEIITFATSKVGKYYYVWGGGGLDGPSGGGFDCSSFVRFVVYQGTGRQLVLPRTSRAQASWAKSKGYVVQVSGPSHIRAGDLVFYARNSGAGTIYHVALAIGGGRIVEAPGSGRYIQVNMLKDRMAGDIWGVARFDPATAKA